MENVKNRQMELVKAENYGIEETTANNLTTGLSIVLKEREVLINNFNDVSKLEVTKENLSIFRELRLKIQKNRTQGIIKWHTETKAYFLKGGQFVDAIKKKEESLNLQMEDKLSEAEKYFDNLEKQRLIDLHNERFEIVKQYLKEPTNTNFSEMEEDVFNAYFNAKKQSFEDEIKQEQEKERLRLLNIELDKKENKRIQEANIYYNFFNKEFDFRNETDSNFITELSNAQRLNDEHLENQRIEQEKLRLEAEKQLKLRLEAEKKAKEEAERLAKERAEIEAEAKKQREIAEEKERQILAEKIRLEAELADKKRIEKEAEESRLAGIERQRLEAEKLAKAPIKEQLNKWVNSFNIDEISIENEVSNDIKAKFESFKKWSISQIDKM